jgi:hypothetical protein
VVISLVGELPRRILLHDPSSICLPGVGIGISAALISVITVWLSDMKMGYCTTGWWLSQKFCCLEISEEGQGCAEWTNWGGVEPFRWIAYMLFAVSYHTDRARLILISLFIGYVLFLSGISC